MDSKVKQRLVGSLVLLILFGILGVFIFHSGNTSAGIISMAPVEQKTPATKDLQPTLKKQAHSLEAQKQNIQIVLASNAQVEKQVKHNWKIQVASFEDYPHAVALQKKLLKKQIHSSIEKHTSKRSKIFYRVVAGPFKQYNQAKLMLAKLQKQLHLKGLII